MTARRASSLDGIFHPGDERDARDTRDARCAMRDARCAMRAMRVDRDHEAALIDTNARYVEQLGSYVKWNGTITRHHTLGRGTK